MRSLIFAVFLWLVVIHQPYVYRPLPSSVPDPSDLDVE